MTQNATCWIPHRHATRNHARSVCAPCGTSRAERVGMNATHLSVEARSYSESPDGPRVLLAEDDAELRGLFAAALRKAGYEVLSASDGGELLSFLSAVSGKDLPRPDAIVMDVNMPGHTGLELLIALRLAEWDVPILLMTAFGDAYLRRRADELGAAVLLDKPLSADALLEALRCATAVTS